MFFLFLRQAGAFVVRKSSRDGFYSISVVRPSVASAHRRARGSVRPCAAGWCAWLWGVAVGVVAVDGGCQTGLVSLLRGGLRAAVRPCVVVVVGVTEV